MKNKIPDPSACYDFKQPPVKYTRGEKIFLWLCGLGAASGTLLFWILWG